MCVRARDNIRAVVSIPPGSKNQPFSSVIVRVNGTRVSLGSELLRGMAPPSNSSTCRWHILGRSGDQRWTDNVVPGNPGERSDLSNITKGTCNGSPEGAAANSPSSQAIGEKLSKHRLLKCREGIRLRLYLLANSCLQAGLILLGMAMFRGRPRLF
jgi:hypothetical protein